MTHIKGAAFRFDDLDEARAFAQRQARPVRVVLVVEEGRPYALCCWVVTPEDAAILERRGYRVVG